MDDARYFFGVLLVTFLPPGILWWLIVHPFIDFWRRVGMRPTFVIMTVISLGWVGSLFTVRDRLLMTDYGFQLGLVVVAVVLASMTVWIALQRRKYLTFRILTGVPELKPDDEPVQMLKEGIYAKMRHPRYVEIIFGTLAYAFFANYLGGYIIAFATIPALHLIVIFEERELLRRFGDEYAEYCARVPRYVPQR
jgi:protein-S-isoprenylcysteine O-methyltransferase Ste14